MKLESVGVLIAMRPFNERDSIAQFFSHDFGSMSGMLRGAIVAKTNKPLVGQIGLVSWNARLDSALGVFHWEPERNLAAPIMLRHELLPFMNAAFDLIITMLPEREQYSVLYDNTVELLKSLPDCSDLHETYLNWEMCLLRELGYALDLSHCSGCGKHETLNYLSPKTGRAVCDDCAAPYIGRLYKLPLRLNTTLKFLEKICAEMGTSVPISRKMIA